jgi:hypothetical protein
VANALLSYPGLFVFIPRLHFFSEFLNSFQSLLIPPKQLTNWKADPIPDFGWSRDGKWLAYAVGSMTSDVVLINDARR